MNKKLIISIMLLVLSGLTASSQAGSIWAKRPEASKSIFADDKAMQIGDVLTVIINEDYKVDTKVNRKLSKDTNHSLDLNGDNVTIDHLVPSIPSMQIEAGSSKSTTGKSDYKDERSIEDRMTVVVEDVHPNGNLVVIGTRTREVSGDRQIVQVSGIVRPSDITFANTIRSEQVANFKLLSINDGVTADYNEPGWLAKIFDAIWPL